MLYINEEIEGLHRFIENLIYDDRNDLFNRMQAWSILAVFNKINHELETISAQLDTSIDLDAIRINFEKYCDQTIWSREKLYELVKRNKEGDNHLSEINRMTDYLPNEVEGYLVTPEVLGSFKTSMHQLCDNERIGTRALWYALDKGLDTMQQLLFDIQEKVMCPKPHLYVKLWDEISTNYNDEEFDIKYFEWLEDTGTPTIDELKARQKQAIYDLLKTGFFLYAKAPTGGEVKKRKLVITEDDLEVGCEVTKEFEIECAKFDRFIEWKEDSILIVNYEKLGQYIYKNYTKLTEDDFFNIKGFDWTIDQIHEAMAHVKPSLAQYLKRYQERQDEELLEDCKKIFKPFKEFLKEDIRPTLIDEYLEKLLFDSEVKEEAKKKLSGQSRNTYCCSIVIALSFGYIFKPEYNNADYAKALHMVIDSVEKKNLERYLKDSKISNSALNSWTTHIMDDLKATPFSRPETG